MTKTKRTAATRDDVVVRVLRQASEAGIPARILESVLSVSHSTMWRWGNPRCLTAPSMSDMQREVIARLEMLFAAQRGRVKRFVSFATAGPVSGIAALFLVTTPNPSWVVDLVVNEEN